MFQRIIGSIYLESKRNKGLRLSVNVGGIVSLLGHGHLPAEKIEDEGCAMN
jgi:hypothetical protein